MTKVRIVYNKRTGKILPHVWNKDGTVTITSSGVFTDEQMDDIVVSLVDVEKVDFECGFVYLGEAEIYGEKS